LRSDRLGVSGESADPDGTKVALEATSIEDTVRASIVRASIVRASIVRGTTVGTTSITRAVDHA
jgi:hypothetical protein